MGVPIPKSYALKKYAIPDLKSGDEALVPTAGVNPGSIAPATALLDPLNYSEEAAKRATKNAGDVQRLFAQFKGAIGRHLSRAHRRAGKGRRDWRRAMSAAIRIPDAYLAHRSSQTFQASIAESLAQYLAGFDLLGPASCDAAGEGAQRQRRSLNTLTMPVRATLRRGARLRECAGTRRDRLLAID
jgi:hypothetical protein